MRLASVLILLSFAALSSALFGPVPYLSELAVAKAGLGLLAVKSVLLGRLLVTNSEDNCGDEMETILETVCKPATIQECQNKPEEKCHNKFIEVCNNVDVEISEDIEENVCQQVSKQQCPKPVESCRTEQKCYSITEKKCDTDVNNTHEEDANNTYEQDYYFCDKDWFKIKCSTHCKDEPELCTPWMHYKCKECGFQAVKNCWDEVKEVCEPQEICENVVVPCKTVFVPECTIKTVPRCKTVTKNICSQEPERVCNTFSRQVCYEKTIEECEEVAKSVPTGKQC